MSVELKRIVLGGGGHARVVVEALREAELPLLGAVVPAGAGEGPGGLPLLGDDEAILSFDPSEVLLVNGVGSTGDPAIRQALFDRFVTAGYRFSTVVHPSAVVSPSASLGHGAQVMAGAVVQTGCEIGANTIVNTGVLIDHDGIIEDHVHLAPGVTLSGAVRVGVGTHLGTGVVVIQGVSIGAGALVGAGAVVIRDLRDGCRAWGVPAREQGA